MGPIISQHLNDDIQCELQQTHPAMQKLLFLLMPRNSHTKLLLSHISHYNLGPYKEEMSRKCSFLNLTQDKYISKEILNIA